MCMHFIKIVDVYELKKSIYHVTVCVFYTRGVQKIRGQMLPFPQFLTEQRETFT